MISPASRGIALIAGPLAALSLATGLRAQDVSTPLGNLICSLGESGEGEIPMSRSRDMVCSFRLSDGGGEEVYTGTLMTIGEHDELTGKRTLVWVVRGPAPDLRPGILQQSYTGSAASSDQQTASFVGDRNASMVLYLMTTGDVHVPGAGLTAAIELKLKVALARSQ